MAEHSSSCGRPVILAAIITAAHGGESDFDSGACILE